MLLLGAWDEKRGPGFFLIFFEMSKNHRTQF